MKFTSKLILYRLKWLTIKNVNASKSTNLTLKLHKIDEPKIFLKSNTKIEQCEEWQVDALSSLHAGQVK